eukprot:CAMPEP_0183744966 /NCGR_PEP_ID=MMETSP0737-20130205/66000_1 /TAXON_ID=385413 /ORGANISM="Thalassiosira miniscula, Strain CCMP1093" /LENGTH=1358 /DNA_ID=CAMNT_0025980621 /DNA_START=110 /DNA_END=4183 /DNA_ORIENTATION=+
MVEHTDRDAACTTKSSRRAQVGRSFGENGRGRAGGRGEGRGRRRGGRGRGSNQEEGNGLDSKGSAKYSKNAEGMVGPNTSRTQQKDRRRWRSNAKREKRRNPREATHGRRETRALGKTGGLNPVSDGVINCRPLSEPIASNETGSFSASGSNIHKYEPNALNPLPAPKQSGPVNCYPNATNPPDGCANRNKSTTCEDEGHTSEELGEGLPLHKLDNNVKLQDGGHRENNMHLQIAEEEEQVEEEKKVVSVEGGTSTLRCRPQFVQLPAGFSVCMGGHESTLRNPVSESVLQAEMQNGGRMVGGCKGDKKSNQADGNRKGLTETRMNPYIKSRRKGGNCSECGEGGPISSTTLEALKKIKGQEVSIGERTMTQIKQEDMGQVSQIRNQDVSKSSSKMVSPVADMIRESNRKLTETESMRRKRSDRSRARSVNDDAANLRAARKFNRSVRDCVARSDAGSMMEILQTQYNHCFALDSNVLEIVMKALVMAAMFDDALYCLRNFTLPGTLNIIQLERILQCLPQNLRSSSAYTAADMIDALCIATQFDQSMCRNYFMRIVRCISLEFLEEATSARDRICSAPCERLVRGAHCVVDARFRRGRKLSDLVVDPGHQLGVFISDNLENRGIQAGDAVSILPYAGPYPMSAESLDRNMIEATVINSHPLVLRLQDKGNSDLFQMLIEPAPGNVYRIDKLANRMGFNRQLTAAVSVASPLDWVRDCDPVTDNRHPSRELIQVITAMDENMNQTIASNGNLKSGSQKSCLTSTAAICSESICFGDKKRGTTRLCSAANCEDKVFQESLLRLEKYGTLQGLNTSQRLAVQGAATNRLSLVQGPPGTGKTAVAIRIIQHWARLSQVQVHHGGTPSPILATSDSNIAVDNLVEGCAKVGLRVVRLGRPEAIRPELLRFCIDRPPDKAGSSSGSISYYGGLSASIFKEKMKVLKNAQVVCCTCIGSGGDILDSMTFERVLVDEATQATEPAVLVPLTRGCRQLVLVGDHCQLPPTVLSTRAEEEGLGVPLFSRMVACGVPPFMLDTQYRMHPGISMFPSDLFYGGKLNDGVSPPERRPLQGFPWPREEFPIAFIPVVDGVEIDDGVSKANEAEALQVCKAVVHLLNGGQCSVSDIAVVTPYSAQVRLIRRQLRSIIHPGPPFVEVSSTDGFQGREKEAVIFSAVRSNSAGAVGFVSDWRRINVSFTRARRALIVVGNPDTLRRGDPQTLGAWLQWADAHGVNMTSPGKPRGRYEPEVLRRVRGGTTGAEMLKDVLHRQQAQLETAKQQQAKAFMNVAGHVTGEELIDKRDCEKYPQALKDDLANLANIHGCWDDSDDDDVIGPAFTNLHVTLAKPDNNDNDKIPDEPLHVW